VDSLVNNRLFSWQRLSIYFPIRPLKVIHYILLQCFFRNSVYHVLECCKNVYVLRFHRLIILFIYIETIYLSNFLLLLSGSRTYDWKPTYILRAFFIYFGCKFPTSGSRKGNRVLYLNSFLTSCAFHCICPFWMCIIVDRKI
jgi:hypothetical protein